MIFSELYSAYYNTVAKIMEAAFNPEATEKDLQRCVMEEAFSESVLTILPALKSGKWPLLHEDLSPVLLHKPTMPLTNLEKRWLKAIAEDPRVKLFGAKFPELDDVEPLFTRDDYKIYDQYSDGDPFEDEAYIEHFRLMLSAIRSECPVQMTIHNYIDTKEMILRKGSIAAHDGELVLIPINMRDGSVLARGKGNPEWNYSAPHGAGRLMSRTKARETLDLEAYRKTMEGIYTTSVNEATIDEAPMAYKSLKDIIDVIRESVDVIEILKPIYNFKASE